MAFLFNIFKKKEEKVNSNSITLYLNDKKTLQIEIDPSLTCQQLCERYAHEFANRNKKPDLRVMLVMEDPKVVLGSGKTNSSSSSPNQPERMIVSKRVLSPLDKVFTEEFMAQAARNNNPNTNDSQPVFVPKLIYKYQLVDMNDFVRISAPIVAYNPEQSTFQSAKEGTPEREGDLTIKVQERVIRNGVDVYDDHSGSAFQKYRVMLTQNELRYYNPSDDKNKTCIPLLCIETVGVGHQDPKSKKYFQIKTSSDVYTVKCNTELDWDLWIKSLIHATNLAKESSLISDINKRIEQVQFFLNEIANKNIICDQLYILEGKQQLRRAIELFAENQSKFGFCSSSGEPVNPDFFPSLLKFLESFVDLRRAKHELKTNPGKFQERVNLCTKALTAELLSELERRRVVGLSVDEEIKTSSNVEETFQALSKVTNDTVYHFMRLSMSNYIFLEDYYSKLEEANMATLQKIIV